MTSIHDRIVAWVVEHGDAEFRLADDEILASEVAWKDTNSPLVYSSKPKSLLSRMARKEEGSSVGVIGTYGVPIGERRQWIQSLSATNPIWFLGDLDGPDVMSYASLIDGLDSNAIKFLGISDSLLTKFAIPFDALDRFQIPATPAEVSAINALFEMGVYIEALVGQNCWSVLQAGKKIEIEGLLWVVDAGELVASIAK